MSEAPVKNTVDKRTIRVRFFGPIMSVVKRSSDLVVTEKEDFTVRELVDELSSRYGEEFRELALHNGEINSGLVIFVNGANALNSSQKLNSDDQIQVLIASQMKGG